MSARVLVAGVGNIFLADDGFGCEVARRLAAGRLPEGVEVVDYGIRGMHLAYDLLAGYDALVIVDALPHEAEPGSVRVLEVGPDEVGADAAALDAHGMEPVAVLAGLGSLGGSLPRTFVVGCEPASTLEGMGLSPAVAASVDVAAAAVLSLLENELVPTGAGSGSAPPEEWRIRCAVWESSPQCSPQPLRWPSASSAGSHRPTSSGT